MTSDTPGPGSTGASGPATAGASGPATAGASGPATAPTSTLSIAEAEDRALRRNDEKPRSQAQLIRARFLRHKAAMVSIVVLVLITLIAYSSLGTLGIPGWWGYTYLETMSVVDGGKPTLSLVPTWLGGDGIRFGEHPLGQDNIGKDYFALVARGTQISLAVGFGTGVIAGIIGTAIGAIAGYYRGWVDAVLMRITDLFIVIPLLVLAAVLGALVGDAAQNPLVLAGILGIVGWTSLARLLRGEILSLRERDFVMAARANGASGLRVIVRHLLPNCVGVIAVNVTFLIAAAILTESALSFLGFGIRPPETSLGQLISIYQGAFTNRPWLFWWPGMLILVIVLCVNFIGDGLRDAFDPRQVRSFKREIARRRDREATALARRADDTGASGSAARGQGASHG